jgi:hypothetical protein
MSALNGALLAVLPLAMTSLLYHDSLDAAKLYRCKNNNHDIDSLISTNGSTIFVCPEA